ncbi:aspartyl protease family protein [Kordia sp. YSTF-M3]|uniref:Aspartyl protease family protein n=1 Tax=Kordia aestuariivivens TaxID=2759037 RepID=A0ABR7Q4Z2_9FLAO|nr:aspartyl protease family protein [Kordia aestuariivivens]MBC8753592.1 aspartyl protease family protein [Kordia aestuariivivens]
MQAQNRFRILNGKDKATVPFKLINNLIVIPVEINGVEMSFLLDSGVNKPILFSLNPDDSLTIEQKERVQLRGLGSGNTITAVKARSNSFKIKNVEKLNLELFIILDKDINVSTRLGIPVHGIIGYDAFRDFIVEINYNTEKIKFYNPETYEYDSCKKCTDLPLTFRNNKPYIDVKVAIEDDEEPDIPVKLLIDSGGSDALWLFEDAEQRITIPDKKFEDFLGRGLSGSIYGTRARVKKFSVGGFSFENAKVAFPDSTAITYVKNFKERNGSIGGEILKRFRVVFDYTNKRIRLRKSKYFSTPFRYNMSGIELQHNGMRVIREVKKRNNSIHTNYGRGGNSTNLGEVSVVFEHYNKFSLVKAYEIAEVRKNSPAALAGLKEGDIIVSINGRTVDTYSLSKVTGILQGKEDKKMRVKVIRGPVELKFEFRLKEVL